MGVRPSYDLSAMVSCCFRLWQGKDTICKTNHVILPDRITTFMEVEPSLSLASWPRQYSPAGTDIIHRTQSDFSACGNRAEYKFYMRIPNPKHNHGLVIAKMSSEMLTRGNLVFYIFNNFQLQHSQPTYAIFLQFLLNSPTKMFLSFVTMWILFDRAFLDFESA